MRIRISGWHLFLFLLGGCSSFNHVNYSYHFQSQNETSVASANPSGAAKCPPFILPEFPPRPAVPLEQLERIKPGDHKAMDKIQQKQIEDLRHHVSDMHRILKEAYEQYLEDCRSTREK